MDDCFYPDMAHDTIYYINIKPYYYYLSFEYMINKFIDSELGKKLIVNNSDFRNLMMEYINLFKYAHSEKNEKEYEVDKVLGKHIISHLEAFFNRSAKNRSVKNRGFKKNKTRKNN